MPEAEFEGGFAPEEETPKNDAMTVLLILTFVFMFTGTLYACWELNRDYAVTFGGMLPPPESEGEAEAPAETQ